MDSKSAFIPIIGKPNVGKSSLMNRILGEKIAIVTDKPQTTRTRIMGVLTKDGTQFVFTDTPGMHKPKNKLSHHMVKQVNDSVSDVDIIVLVVEPTGNITNAELNLIEMIKSKKSIAILAINKIDTLSQKDKILERINEFSKLHDFDAIVPLSAMNGDGIDNFMTELEKYAVPSVHFFDDDTLTDQPERVIVAEIIREKVLRLMYQEIPHGISVTIESMKERTDKPLMDIDAIIFCERESHKGMVIGKNGEMLKRVASEARTEIESILNIKINLKCWVKVKEDWRNKENFIKSFGLNNS